MSGIAGSYHEKTSYGRSQMSGHFLDWQNQPVVFKTYEGLETIPMPRQVPLPRENLFSLYGGSRNAFDTHRVFDLEKLSEILLLTYTLTSQSRISGERFYFRSAASAGALYPTEIYVLSNGLKDLDDGLYHFSIAAHGLVKLREGRLSDVTKGFVNEGDFHETPLTFFLTAIFFRSAWKYRERSYRYHLLDTGHVLENLDLALKSLRLASETTFDFEDRSVNDMLGLDENREAALALCRVRGNAKTRSGSTAGPRPMEALPEAVKRASRVSRREFDSPEVLRVHRAGYDVKPGEKDFDMCGALGIGPEAVIPMPATPLPDAGLDYPDAVFRRRSSRNFIAETLPLSHLHALIKMVSERGGAGNNRFFNATGTGFLTNRVESLRDGFYLLDAEGKGLSLVKSGAFTKDMSHICLDQEWMASASLHFVFMTPMNALERLWGPRGYRYAMMTAGVMGERLYLGASALGLGCCGIGAFYDGEASRLLDLGTSSRVLYVVSLGILKSMMKRDVLL